MKRQRLASRAATAAQGRSYWSSRLGVILAVSGSAVGIGNFLRFPGNAAENGGGAFLIPYFIAFLLLGIPIGWAEWTMGRLGGQKGMHSAPAIIGHWGHGAVARYLGTFAVLIPLVVYFYYVLIEAWCLSYAWDYLSGGVGIATDQTVALQVAESTHYFNEVAGSNADGIFVDGGLRRSVIFWLVAFALNLWFLYRGLSRGIEAFCRWAMPAMAVCALVVLVRVLTLGTPDPGLPEQSVASGLNFMWNPDFSALGNFKTWLAATGQIFFSLSVGLGVIVNYASYMNKDDDVLLSSLTSSATNEFFEVVFGGMITLTAAVIFLGLTATRANVGGTFSTGFATLPVVFARMPYGDFFGAIWFFMLFLAAITSSLSMLQPAKAFFREALGISHGAAVAIVAALCFAGNIFVLWFSKGLVALDTLDFWVGTFMIFILAGTQIVCFSWVFGIDNALAEARRGAQIRMPGIMRFVMKYVSPTYLVVIFLGFCWYNLPPYVRSVFADPESGVPADRSVVYAWLVIVGMVVLLMVVTAVGARRWRAQGLDIDGRRTGASP